MRSPTRASVACFGLWLVGCAGQPPAPPPYGPRPVVEVGRWQVVSAGQPVGYLVHFEIRDPTGPVTFYRILDLQGRWLGHATEQGRFSRRVPFQDDEEDLGVWSMAQGVARLVDASAPVDLKPVAADADARRPR